MVDLSKYDFSQIEYGMDDLSEYYILDRSKIQIYANTKVKDSFSFFLPSDKLGNAVEFQKFRSYLNDYLQLAVDGLKLFDYNLNGDIIKTYRINFYFYPSVPSLANQEEIFKKIDDKLVDDFLFTDFSDLGSVSKKPKKTSKPKKPKSEPTLDPVMTNNLSAYEVEMEATKKEIEQLITLRSLVSPIDFEMKLMFNQDIAAAQKKLNDLNFKIIESKIDKDDIFDDLFEQSFAPIQNAYDGIYATGGTGENPQSSNFFTPNGMPSKLSDELNMLIRTPQFNEWFGNWQLIYAYKELGEEFPCSKVITKDYEPLLVWHGTGTQFSYFRFDSFPAAYFAVNRGYSEWFADLHGENGGYTIPFFLNVRNPLDLTHFKTTKIKPKEFFDYMYLETGMDMKELEVNPLFMDSSAPPMETWVYLRNNASMLKKLADSHVFDGINFYETNPSVPEGQVAHVTEAYIILNPNQCKIADPNRGKYMFGSFKSFLLKKGGKI